MKKQKGGNKKEESGRLSRFLPFVLVCVKSVSYTHLAAKEFMPQAVLCFYLPCSARDTKKAAAESRAPGGRRRVCPYIKCAEIFDMRVLHFLLQKLKSIS